MRTSCLDYAEGHKPKGLSGGGLQGVSQDSDSSGYDYNLGLYNENSNGIWKGRGFFFEILMEKVLGDTVQFIEVMPNGIFIYDSSDVNSRVLIKKLNMVNQVVLCYDQMEACTVQQLEDSQKAEWDPTSLLKF
jgi:hypothetical protein